MIEMPVRPIISAQSLDLFKICQIIILLLLFSGTKAQTFSPPDNTTLTSATVGLFYNQTFIINVKPTQLFNLSISNASALPPGLTIQNNQLRGVPTHEGNHTITLVLLSISIPLNTRQSYNLIINGISANTTLPKLYVNVPFIWNVSYVGGIPPFVFIISNQSSWVGINNSLIYGTPKATGNTTFQLTILDFMNNSFTKLWTIQVNKNVLTLSPSKIFSQVDVMTKVNFTVSNGSPPYKFQYINPPLNHSVFQNSMNITISAEGEYKIGIFITDSAGLRNYFDVTVYAESNNQNVQNYNTNVTSYFVDQNTKQFYTIYKIPPNDLGPGFSIQNGKTKTPLFNYDSLLSKSTSIYSSSSSHFIRSSSTTNNKNPCNDGSNTIEGSGVVAEINSNDSMIILNSLVTLIFRQCTLQAFRGTSETFEIGNFVTYQGILQGNTILLVSITNTT